MTDPDLRVEVVDDEIIVSLRQSGYSVTYYKPENSPQPPTPLEKTMLCVRGANYGTRTGLD